MKKGKINLELFDVIMLSNLTFRYAKKRLLYCHLKQHAENKIVCLECGHMSVTKDEHNIHMLQHDKNRPWQCEICKDKFSRKQQYLFHIKVLFIKFKILKYTKVS